MTIVVIRGYDNLFAQSIRINTVILRKNLQNFLKCNLSIFKFKFFPLNAIRQFSNLFIFILNVICHFFRLIADWRKGLVT